MVQRKAKDLGKLDHSELLALARRVSDSHVDRETSIVDLQEVIGRSLSTQEIKNEVRQIRARRKRGVWGERWGRHFASPRLAMGLMVLAIVVSSSYVAYLGSAPPQYYLVPTSEDSLGTAESVDSVYLPLGTVDMDGNLFVATQPPNNSLAKFGPTGVEEWRRSFIVEQGSSAYALSIAIDAGAQHIYVAGYSEDSIGVDRKGFLACFDPFGEAEWVRIWGSHSEAKSVATSNGSVWVAGRTGYAAPVYAFIIRYDSEGNSLWNITRSGSEASDASAICSDADGNVFVAAVFDLESILIKYDSVGSEVWKSTWAYPSDLSGKLVRIKGAYVYTLDDEDWLSMHSAYNGAFVWRKPLGWSRSRYYVDLAVIELFHVDTFSVEGDGGIKAGGIYSRTEIRDSGSTAIHSVCVTSFDPAGRRSTNITAYLDDQLYVGSMVLGHGGNVYVVGGIYDLETFEWELVLMQFAVMSSFLAGFALVVGLASVACITLAVLWKENRINLRTRRRQ